MSAERVCHHVRMRGAELVRALYERYQARDWTGAAAPLHPEAQLRMPATDEYLLGRQQVLAFQRNYPEPWGELRVLRAASDSTVAVAEIAIVRDTDVFRCAAFWTTQEDTLLSGVEYWVTVVVTSRHRTALSPRTDSGPLDSGAAGQAGGTGSQALLMRWRSRSLPQPVPIADGSTIRAVSSPNGVRPECD